MTMDFYFIVHTLLGLVAANAGNIQMRSKQSVGAFPLWVHGFWGVVGGLVTILCAFGAVATTTIQWGFGWALYTIGEIVLGAVIVMFLPMGLRFLIALMGPIVSVVIMGMLWGFWYI